MLRDGALEGEVIVITGGGTGLGKSMATYFLELGAEVIITGRRENKLDETVKELDPESKGNIMGVPCDVRKYEEVENVLAKGIEKYGKVTGLVNNAAGNFVSPTERLSHRAFDAVVDIVLRGSYNNTLAFGKYWIENKIKGSVLNIVTTYAWTGTGFTVPSACGKAGVLALTRSLGSEWGKYGIRSNAIAPGPFPTKGAWDRLFPPKVQELINPDNRIPLKRLGEHQELANLAAYIMSPFAAYMTGEVVTLDGGEWLKGAGQFNWAEEIPESMWDMVEQQIRMAKRSKADEQK